MSRSWKADSVRTRWSNKYGSLVVKPVTQVQAVSEIHGVDISEGIKFDLETAEEIALITDNHRCQLSGRLGQHCLLVHTSSSMAAVVSVESLDFVSGVVPEEEIAMVARRGF